MNDLLADCFAEVEREEIRVGYIYVSPIMMGEVLAHPMLRSDSDGNFLWGAQIATGPLPVGQILVAGDPAGFRGQEDDVFNVACLLVPES
jgi:hypothetical protein